MSAKYLYLASRSVRRKQLLRQIGVDFSCRVAAVDEAVLDGEKPAVYVERLAIEKARDVAGSVGQENSAVLAADTTVVLGGRIFGKPANREDALEMLQALSGKGHQVFTAVAMAVDGKTDTRLSVSEVTIRPLSEALIERYWQTGEPAGKAGGYAIQGYAAGFIKSLTGSYSGVMGLPLYETVELLEQAGIGWALQHGPVNHA
ncbi:MAG: septum formation inhibitor Maf [Proteobacteria bacterium]|nr:septum formation inhibitor Maf [Pseudomonadota bacterium]